jgi:hypothetical protein
VALEAELEPPGKKLTKSIRWRGWSATCSIHVMHPSRAWRRWGVEASCGRGEWQRGERRWEAKDARVRAEWLTAPWEATGRERRRGVVVVWRI